jgi:hypothetical protein
MLEVLKLYPRIIGTFVGIAIGLIIEGSIGGTTTLMIGLSAMSLYVLAAFRGWF